MKAKKALKARKRRKDFLKKRNILRVEHGRRKKIEKLGLKHKWKEESPTEGYSVSFPKSRKHKKAKTK